MAIIRRVDTDGDAKITFSEWADFLRSCEPAGRQVLQDDLNRSRARSAEKWGRKTSAYDSPLRQRESSPLRGHSATRTVRFQSPARPASAGVGASPMRSSYASPAKQSSPLRESLHASSAFKESGGFGRSRSPFRRGSSPLRLSDEDELVTSLKG